jgi:hypothetical protein
VWQKVDGRRGRLVLKNYNMIDFTEENRQTIYWHLTSFHSLAMLEESKGVPIGVLADRYIDNEISMQKGLQDYYDYLKDENNKNHALLNDIKKEKGKTFFKYLMEIIEESEGIKGLAEIVNEPVGKFQKEKYGRQIDGIWLEQWGVGDTGDSWNGYVCVKLSEERYLKFSYSM